MCEQRVLGRKQPRAPEKMHVRTEPHLAKRGFFLCCFSALVAWPVHGGRMHCSGGP